MTALTREKWAELAVQIDNLWSATDFTEGQEETWWPYLAAFSEEDVQSAIGAMVGKDPPTPFAPSCNELVVWIRRVSRPQVPSWSEAQWMIWDVAMKHAGLEEENEGLEWLFVKDESGTVADWVRIKGWKRLWMEPVDPSNPRSGMILEKLKQEYEDFAEHRVDADQREFGKQLALTAQRTGKLGRTDPLKAIDAPERDWVAESSPGRLNAAPSE